jgi:DegV family protein with EDD domain
MGIKIVTDSTCYIPKDVRESQDISVVSLSVNFGSETYLEEEMDYESFYKRLKESAELPTSSQPTLHSLINCFEKIVSAGHSVVGVFISSLMSGTYSTALTAKGIILKKYPEAIIEIIDSKSNSMEMGFAVLAGAVSAKAEESLKNVIDSINYVIDRSRFLFVPETLTYLKKGGRIGTASALFGAMLQIRPILTVTDGMTAVFDKVRTKKKAVERIVEFFLNEIKEKGLGKVVVHHINCESEGRELADYIQSKTKREVPVYSIGPIIGLHVGPGTIGIAYYTE